MKAVSKPLVYYYYLHRSCCRDLICLVLCGVLIIIRETSLIKKKVKKRKRFR